MNILQTPYKDSLFSRPEFSPYNFKSKMGILSSISHLFEFETFLQILG